MPNQFEQQFRNVFSKEFLTIKLLTGSYKFRIRQLSDFIVIRDDNRAFFFELKEVKYNYINPEKQIRQLKFVNQKRLHYDYFLYYFVFKFEGNIFVITDRELNKLLEKEKTLNINKINLRFKNLKELKEYIKKL